MNDPNGKIYPLFQYNDAQAAVDWLQEVFGFTERNVYRDDNGTIVHAELQFGDSIIMFGQASEPTASEPAPDDYRVYVAVSDVEAHHDRAVAAGARVIEPLTDRDYGSREYTARDLDGNIWSFGSYKS